METTLNIQDDLMRQAQKLAADRGQTLTAVVEDALRAIIARSETTNGQQKRIVLPTFDSRGVMPGVDIDKIAHVDDASWPILNLGPTQPGVDLNNTAALLDLLDEGDDSI